MKALCQLLEIKLSMKKTLLYLGLLAILIISVWHIVYNSKAGTFGEDEAGFTVKDTAGIGKIFLADKKGNSVLLERTSDGWNVNGNDKAMIAPVNTLLRTLYKQVADVPVSEKQHNRVITDLSGSSIKAELYDRKGKLMRVFYVGEEAYNMSGTFMLMEGAQRPYIVNVPAFDGVLTPRYSPYLKDWRDRTVFNIAAEDIEQISVQYPDQPMHSFTMRRVSDSMMVFIDTMLQGLGTLNRNRVNAYLGFFSNIHSEGYTNGDVFVDSLLKEVPRRCIIDVIGKNGYAQHVIVFWRPLDKRSKNLDTPMPGHPNEYDSDRFYAVLNNNKDTAVIQRAVFDKIFRSGFEFFQDTQPVEEQEVHEHRH